MFRNIIHIYIMGIYPLFIDKYSLILKRATWEAWRKEREGRNDITIL